MSFRPEHLSAIPEHFDGNGGQGRFLLLPGSPGRAEAIAGLLSDVTTHRHPRGHDLHLGAWSGGAGLPSVDVGVVATGMGGASVEIIVSELLALGARTLLRIGTSGGLQERVAVGDLVIASAAVRDEGAADAYLPREFPALAALPIVDALRAAAAEASLSGQCHVGLVHSKDTLYAREFAQGPLREEHLRYRRLLTDSGVLASEMECATLFALGGVSDQAAQLRQPPVRVRVGAVLAVIGGADAGFARTQAAEDAVDEAIHLGLSALQRLL